MAIMEISQVTLNDAGQYQCIAKNARGEAAATIALSLEGKDCKAAYIFCFLLIDSSIVNYASI